MARIRTRKRKQILLHTLHRMNRLNRSNFIIGYSVLDIGYSVIVYYLAASFLSVNPVIPSISCKHTPKKRHVNLLNL